MHYFNYFCLRLIYTCALNDGGGVECDSTVNVIKSGTGDVHDPQFEVNLLQDSNYITYLYVVICFISIMDRVFFREEDFILSLVEHLPTILFPISMQPFGKRVTKQMSLMLPSKSECFRFRDQTGFFYYKF